MNTERALTLALVLVAVGYGPGAIPYAFQRSASTGPTRAVAARPEASRSSEARTAAHESERRLNRAAPIPYGELPTGTLAIGCGQSCEIVAPRATSNPLAFLTPPSVRGPPTLG